MTHPRFFLGVVIVLAMPAAASEWQTYGATPGGTRFASIDTVSKANVRNLEKAWTYQTGDMGEGFPSRGGRSFEATPILIEGLLYFSTPYGQIHALEPASGKLVWKYLTSPPKDRSYSENTSRGVSFWRDPLATGPCSARIFFGTQDARLLALDAKTGLICDSFGDEGVVDLNLGSRPFDPGNYSITSPPAIWQDVVVTGSAVGDNSAVNLEYGIVRGIDARTGEILWTWDPVPRDPADPAHAEWRADQVAQTGAANAWSVLSVDPQAGLVFVPTGSASPDFYGGERLGTNANANSVVALEAATGKVRWARQLVHHDIWDYDVPAQPVLIDLERGGEQRKALVQITKMGMVFVLDRLTGEPIFPIEERPVPATDVPGEVISKTQPFSTLPPLVDHGAFTEDDAFGLTPIDRWDCRRQIRKYRSEGIYTPPSLAGTILYPSYAGGGNWGSVAYDPIRQRIIANVSHLPAVVQLIPRAQFDIDKLDPPYPDSQYSAQAGTPYGMRRQMILSFLGVPCNEPPWGTLAALDLRAGEIAWQVPLGTSEDIAPWPFKDIQGVPGIGGPMITSGGLVFIGAALDNYLRAFDIDSGEELWRGRLPAGGQATPMTYESGGQQYIVIAAGGHGGAGSTLGDYLVAFSLRP